MENPQELEKKVGIYKEALVDTIKKLTQKRTELGELAKQTVENLEASIPELRRKVEEKQRTIEALDAAIAQKKAEFNSEKENLKESYKNLEGQLLAEYDKKYAEIEKIKNDLDKREKEVHEMIYSIDVRRKSADDAIGRLEAKNNEFNKQVDEFYKYKQDVLRDIDIERDDLNKSISSVTIREEVVSNKETELNEKSKILDLRVKQADSVIERIGEVQEILNITKNKESQIKEKEIYLNELNAKNIADRKNLSLKSEALDEREKKLNERENNLKIAEAVLGK